MPLIRSSHGQNFLTAACGTQIFGTGGYGQCGLGNVTLNPKFIASNPAFGGANTQFYQSASSPFGIYGLDVASFLTARLRVAQWHGLTLNTSYVWSQSRDNASDAAAPLLPTTLLNQMLGVQYYGLGNQFPVQLGLIPQLKSGFANSTVATPFVNVSEALNTALTTTGARQVFVSRYTVPQDPYNFLRNDWGPSDFDSPHRVVIDYVWRIPGKANSFLLAGWEVSGILTAQSGQPFSIFAGPAGGELTQRVNVGGAVTMTGNPS